MISELWGTSEATAANWKALYEQHILVVLRIFLLIAKGKYLFKYIGLMATSRFCDLIRTLT